ncbi:MAG: DUF3224 domain-containing protein [Tahibacter sp.]
MQFDPGFHWRGCVAIALALLAPGLAMAHDSHSLISTNKKDSKMDQIAKGPFDVKLTPQSDADVDARIGRMTIVKQFHGDLEANSSGQMLSAMGEVQGSAGYVAIERVVGTLQGREGSFVLQHSGTMNRGSPQLTLTVVPDSGTGQLVGLAGSMEIIITDGKHAYAFSYSVAGSP